MSRADANNSKSKTGTGHPTAEKRNKGKLIAIIGGLLGVIIIIALIVIIVVLLGRTNEPATIVEDLGGGRGVLVTPENVDEMRSNLQTPVADGYYESKMNTDWVFKTAKTPSENAYVENLTTNTRTVYFDLTLADTGELIYSSPYIPLGGKLTNFALDTEVAAGNYSGVVTYHLVDDDNNELSTVSVSVKVRVQG